MFLFVLFVSALFLFAWENVGDTFLARALETRSGRKQMCASREKVGELKNPDGESNR